MSEKTVHEIREEHARRAAEITGAYFDAKDRIRDEREPADGAYLDRLNAGQRRELLEEQKRERLGEAHRRAREAYEREVSRYQDEVARRRAELKERLFGVGGPEGASALSRAVLADDDELTLLMDAAVHAGNRDLARAVLVAADRRGRGDLLGRYFDEMDGEARPLYQEWSELPAEELLERQRESVDRVLPPPTYPGALDAPLRATT